MRSEILTRIPWLSSWSTEDPVESDCAVLERDVFGCCVWNEGGSWRKRRHGGALLIGRAAIALRTASVDAISIEEVSLGVTVDGQGKQEGAEIDLSTST